MDYRAGETLLVDKDLGWTSFDVVNKLRYALKALYGVKKFKVGHAGTLDPPRVRTFVDLYGEEDERN